VLVKALAVLGPLHVEQLADLLWPGIDALTGRRRLRNVLRRAREVLGDLLLREEAVVRLHPDVQVDAVVFDAEVRRALALPAGAPWRGELARRALDRYRGPLLPGDRYEDWSVPPRERLADAAALAWDLLAGEAARAGDPAEAAAHLEEALAIYPHDDERRQRVAELHVAAGQPAEALRHLEDAPPPGLLLPDGLGSS
jgi:DNA-binding SARP family transcriptional activator